MPQRGQQPDTEDTTSLGAPAPVLPAWAQRDGSTSPTSPTLHPHALPEPHSPPVSSIRVSVTQLPTPVPQGSHRPPAATKCFEFSFAGRRNHTLNFEKLA